MGEHRWNAPSRGSGGAFRREGSKWRRTGVVVLATVLVLMLTAGAALGLLWWRGEASLDRIDVQGLRDRVAGRDRDGTTDGSNEPGPSGSPQPASQASAEPGSEDEPRGSLREPFVVLVTGIDGDTSGLTAQERRRVALGGDREGQRPDTIILLRVDPGQDQVAMLSLPRDLLVRRCNGSLGKINGAYEIGRDIGIGGPSCLVQTIFRHTGIGIQHYVEVSFAGFLDVIDAVGGVQMYIPDRLFDRQAKLDLQPGCQVLDGPEALAYVRVRNIDNDFGRMARQQAFAEELLEEVTAAGTLANPLRLYRLVEAAAGSVDVDDTLGLGQMRDIAASLRNLNSERLASETITGAIVTREDLGGASVVEEDRTLTEPIYRAFREGRFTQGLPSSEPPEPVGTPTPEPEPTVPTVEASEVPPVEVLNGVGTAMLASDTRTVLQNRGFRVSRVDDAPIQHSRSVVQYGPGLEAEAETVAQALGGLRTFERVDLGGAGSAQGPEIIVVLGEDIDPQNVPDLRGTPAPSPSATATPAPDTTPSALPSLPDREFEGIPTGNEGC